MPGESRGFMLTLMLFIMICSVGCGAAETPVARVNDVIISQQELQRFINLMELCNPEAALPGESTSAKRRAQEFLHIFIGFKLVDQEAVKVGVVVEPAVVEDKRDEILRDLVENRYAGSSDEFYRRLKGLGLDLDDLALLSRYELQGKELFERAAPAIEESELILFIEENPGLFMQADSADLHRFRFGDEQTARESLTLLEQGAALEDITAAGEWSSLGWVTGEDPFLAKPVREELFPSPRAGSGCLEGSSGQCYLYWIQKVRPSRQLDSADTREEAALLKRSLLCEQFYYKLWGEGRIEIYLDQLSKMHKTPAGDKY